MFLCETGLISFTVLFYGIFLTTTILMYIFYANDVSTGVLFCYRFSVFSAAAVFSVDVAIEPHMETICIRYSFMRQLWRIHVF